MQLDELLQRDDVPALEVTGIASDSRHVSEGDLFIAYRGREYDAVEFAEEAVRSGAIAVLADRPAIRSSSVPWIVDRDASRIRGEIAARFFGDPSGSLECIAVTGTNGKTSVTHGCAQVIEDTACMGTLGFGTPPDLVATELTTDDPVEVQRQLRLLCDSGKERVAIEASSHALDQSRLDEVSIDIAVFTNLSRDHLDYHDSMANYAAAKRRLFERADVSAAVVNVDDEFGRSVVKLLEQRGIPTIRYGVRSHSDLSWNDLAFTPTGTEGKWLSSWGEYEFRLPWLGDFGVANAAAIFAIAHLSGADVQTTLTRMASMFCVPGRADVRSTNGGPTVIVDYAHTPDGLLAVLRLVQRHYRGQITCVFGCGGDRDRGKRPLMAQAVQEFACSIYVTNDNPRFENPARIVDDILGGFSHLDRVRVELDRTRAIELAIRHASAEDVVVIAGKGHETYQHIGGRYVPHCDLDTVDRILATN